MRIAFPAIAAALLVASPLAAAGEGWITDFDAALDQARSEGRVVVADFNGSDWCKPCQQLRAKILDSATFRRWAAEHAVLLDVDFPMKKPLPEALRAQNGRLKERYGIRGFPTVLVLDGEGKELGRIFGYAPTTTPEEFVARLESFLPGPKLEWLTDFDEAKKRAAAEKKLILADFTGSDWCVWCKRLKKEVFDTPAFRKWAARNVVLLEVDFPRKKKLPKEVARRNRELLERYGVEGFPTLLFLAPDGEKVGQMGYIEGGPAKWLPEAKRIAGDRGARKAETRSREGGR